MPRALTVVASISDRIGYWILDIELIYKGLLFLWGIVGNGDDPEARLFEVSQAFLQLHELLLAVGSPVDRSVHIDYQPLRSHKLVHGALFRLTLPGADVRECFTDTDSRAILIRVLRDKHVLCVNRNGSEYQTDGGNVYHQDR